MRAEVAVLGGRRWSAHREPAAVPAQRPRVRLLAFVALAGYGVLRWATLINPAPGWRLFGLLALALVLAVAGTWLAPRVPRPLAAAAVLAIVGLLAALAIAGLPAAWLVHARVAVTARAIGNGLGALPGVLVPYLGADATVTLVIALGAGVLLLDAALLLAFAPVGELRRGAAALPLVVLAIVPAALVRPALPYLQGIILFALLVGFMWAERLPAHEGGLALDLAALAAIGGLILAPRLDPHRPWLDYQSLAGRLASANAERFTWDQRFGPIGWPRNGHQVLEVRAQAAGYWYWKAANLDLFDGQGWAAAGGPLADRLPAPAGAKPAWTQTLHVSITGMRTSNLISAGTLTGQPAGIAQGIGVAWTGSNWVTSQPLGPGDTYTVQTYLPRPSATELRSAGDAYPWGGLEGDLALELPGGFGGPSQVEMGPFHSGQPAQPVIDPAGESGLAMIESSPYARAYRLARALARGAASPYAFVEAVQRYLSTRNGFSYDEQAPLHPYPLEAFLFSDRRGYCQQFAGAMALLLRLGGLPARVAAGFTSGAYDRLRREWVVSDLDAHDWVEVWFPRYGWVTFDPTPAAAPEFGGRVPSIVKGSLTSAGRPAAAVRRPDTGATAASTRVSRRRGGSFPALLVALLAAGGLALMTGAGLWWRGRRAAGDLVAELERAMARCGRPLPAAATLTSLERRFDASPAAAAYVRALRLSRYADRTAAPSARQRRALRAQLAAGHGLAGRLRAIWALPPRRLNSE